MTNPTILDALARAIHGHDGRLPTPWDADMITRWPDDCEYERKVAMSQAAAVLDLVGPRELVWDGFISGRYEITVQAGGIADLRCHTTPVEDDEPEYIKGGYLTLVSLDDLKAAAQAHADAAHWANTKIGGE